jgi:hypothetical protein
VLEKRNIFIIRRIVQTCERKSGPRKKLPLKKFPEACPWNEKEVLEKKF